MEYKHLTAEERYQIDDLKREGFSLESIAEKLSRSFSTIFRELKRNKGERGWRPGQAEEKAKERLSVRGSSNVRRIKAETWEYAKQHLEEDQWSPEQIAGKLKLEGKAPISHETIYKRILEDKKVGGNLYTNLRCKKKRKKRYGSNRKKREIIPNRVGIEKRPSIVESRGRVGDWEGDTIIGTHTSGAVIATVVERKSRFLCMAKAQDKTTVAVMESINARMKPLAELMSTLTLDNGTEFTQHAALTKELDVKVYFAKPYHSWERGLNENTNGLIRQYCPKGISFNAITEEELKSIENKLNNRPRKCLGYQTPYEVFKKACMRRDMVLQI